MTPTRTFTWTAVVSAAAAFLALPAATAAIPPPSSTADGTGVAQSPCFARDNRDPVLTSASVNRSTVDVSRHAGTFTFTVLASDRGGPGPASGVAYVRVRFAHEIDRHTGVTLRHVTGHRWVGTLLVGKRVRGGDDRVTSVLIRDKAGNAHLVRSALPFSVVSPSGRLLAAVTADPDTVAPVLHSVVIAPGTVVDTRRHARKVTVTARATDTGGSGVAGVRVRFFVLGSRARFGDPIEAGLRPTTGDRLSGTVTVPTWAGSSTWRVAYAGVADRAGNTRLYEGDDRAQLGPHQSFQVVSGLDRTRPRLGPVKGMPPAINVRNRHGWVVLSVRARDAASGISSVRASLVAPRPDSSELDRANPVPFRLVRGDRHNGVWTARVPVRSCYFPVSGRLMAEVDVIDRARNTGPTRRSPASAMSTLPLVGAVVVGGHLEQPGPPVLSFDRPVVGIDARSARAFELDRDGILHQVSGTWVCATTSGLRTPCRTGKVRVAVLEPDVAPDNLGEAYVLLNPPGVLDVRDLSGVPFRRAVVYYSYSYS